MTRNVKKKLSDNNKSLRGTGGGPCRMRELNENEQELSEVLPHSAVAGVDVDESLVDFVSVI